MHQFASLASRPKCSKREAGLRTSLLRNDARKTPICASQFWFDPSKNTFRVMALLYSRGDSVFELRQYFDGVLNAWELSKRSGTAPRFLLTSVNVQASGVATPLTQASDGAATTLGGYSLNGTPMATQEISGNASFAQGRWNVGTVTTQVGRTNPWQAMISIPIITLCSTRWYHCRQPVR
jgi:hypothetical protein